LVIRAVLPVIWERITQKIEFLTVICAQWRTFAGLDVGEIVEIGVQTRAGDGLGHRIGAVGERVALQF
jgi:hypothetical protein